MIKLAAVGGILAGMARGAAGAQPSRGEEGRPVAAAGRGAQDLSPDEIEKLWAVATYVRDRHEDAFAVSGGGAHAVLHGFYVEHPLLRPRAFRKFVLEGWTMERGGVFNAHYFIDLSPQGRVLGISPDETDGGGASFNSLDPARWREIARREIDFWLNFSIPAAQI